MSIFEKVFKTKKGGDRVKAKSTPEEETKRVEKPSPAQVHPAAVTHREAPSTLKRPLVSEKSRNLGAVGKYVFIVDDQANKSEIRKEVERRYGVSVKSVNILRTNRRGKRFGRNPGRSHMEKKAIVTLKSGQTIDVFPV